MTRCGYEDAEMSVEQLFAYDKGQLAPCEHLEAAYQRATAPSAHGDNYHSHRWGHGLAAWDHHHDQGRGR